MEGSYHRGQAFHLQFSIVRKCSDGPTSATVPNPWEPDGFTRWRALVLCELTGGTPSGGDPAVCNPTQLVTGQTSIWTASLKNADQEAADLAERFDRILIMAQMSRGEAVELSGLLRRLLKYDADPVNDGGIVDTQQTPILILSEAESDHASPDSTVTHTNGDMIPVLTPTIQTFTN